MGAREYLCIREIIISMCASIHLPIYPSIHPSICLSVRLPVCRYIMHGSGRSTSHYISTFPAGTVRVPPRPHACPGAAMKAGRVRRKKRRKGEDGTEEEPPKARGALLRQDCTEHHLVTTARSIRICILYHIMICKKCIRSASSVESL